MKLKNITILIFLLLFILTLGAVSASSDNSTDVVAADDDNDLEMQSDSGQILASNEDDDVVCDVGNGTVLSKASSSLSIEFLSEVYAGDDVAVTVLLTPSDATGNVLLSVDEENNQTGVIAEGSVTFMLSGLTVGSHNLKAVYFGDENYEGCENSASFTVIKKNSTMSVTYNDINLVDNVTVTVFLPNDATGNITLSLNGMEYEVILLMEKFSSQFQVWLQVAMLEMYPTWGMNITCKVLFPSC